MAEQLLQELHSRWRRLYRQLDAGADTPPALRLRTEGMMEAAELAGLASAEQLQLAMAGVYREVYGRPLEADFGDDWREFYPFPQIPAVMQRAPVVPSTRD